MIVYIVMNSFDDCSRVVRTFSTLEKAQDWIIKNDPIGINDCYITEWELDSDTYGLYYTTHQV